MDRKKESQFRVFVRTEEPRGSAVPDRDAIQDHFSRMATVLDINHPRTQPTVCYVTFSSHEDVLNVLSCAEQLINGVTCSVHKAAAKGSSGMKTDRIYVTQLRENCTKEAIQDYFAQIGAVRDVFLPHDKNTGIAKPYCFVTFSNPRDAFETLKTPTHTIDGTTVVVEPAEPPRSNGEKGMGKGFDYGMGMIGMGMAKGYGKGDHGSGDHGKGSRKGKGKDDWQERDSHRGYEAQQNDFFRGDDRNVDIEVASVLNRFGGIEGLTAALNNAQYGGGAGASGFGGQRDLGEYRLFVIGMPEGLTVDHLRGHYWRDGNILDVFQPPNRSTIAYVSFEDEMGLMNALQDPHPVIAGFQVKKVEVAEKRSKRTERRPREEHRGRPY